MSPLSQSMLDLALKGAVLLGAAALAVLALRRAPAALRHLVWSLAAVGLAALPVLGTAIPPIELPVLPPRVETPPPPPTWEPELLSWMPPAADAPAAALPTAAVAPVVPAPETVPTPPPPARLVATPAEAEPAATPPAAPDPLLLVWLAGTVLVLLPYAVGVLRLRRALRSARRFRAPGSRSALEAARDALGLQRPVRVVETEAVPSPATFGFLRPLVLLPEEARGWSPARLRVVLLHELAHVRRRDGLVELLARLVFACHWFDPLAWLAARGLRRESERACDDLVLLAGEPPAEYATCLLEVARGPVGGAALAMARPGRFEGRLRAILSTKAARRAGRRVAIATLVLGGLIVGGIGLVRPTERAAADEEPVAYDVGPAGEAPYATVQAALDAAERGAVIRVAPGTYDGRIEVRRAVTLVGAGPERTLIAGDVLYHWKRREPEAKPEDLTEPVVLVEGTRDVVFRDLAFTGRSERVEGATRQDAIVVLRGAQATFEHCAFRDSASCALLVGDGSETRVERCLVGAIAANGIVIGAAKATIVDSDVRDVYHYGIAIRPGSEAVVEGSRISGSLWHGIRYDHCSPTIRRNVIFENSRSGIYASGRTQAVVEDNLFLRNVFGGMSCWFENHDTIRRNCFVGDGREALAILGGSNPQVENNLFVRSPIAVLGGHIGGGGGKTRFEGTPDVRGCWFWEGEHAVVVPLAEPAPDGNRLGEVPWDVLAKAGNLRADPGYANEEPGALVQPAPAAAAAGVGISVPLAWTSPWPLSDAEKAWRSTLEAPRKEFFPVRRPKVAGDGPTAPEPAPARKETAQSIAEPWIQGLHDLQDADRRRRAEASIRRALECDDPHLHHAAFVAITRSGRVAWDRVALREPVLRRLRTAEGPAQVSGFYALFNTHPRPEDLDLLVAALRDPSPSLERQGAHLVVLFSGGELDGPAADSVLRLLETDDRHTLRNVLSGLWGAHVNDAVEARLLEIAAGADDELYHDVVYYALSTLPDKSPAVVAELARAASKPTGEVGSRAIWGLSQGVSPAAREAAAEVLLAAFERRTGVQVREWALRGLAESGGAKHAAALERALGSPALDTRLKGDVERAVRDIRLRLAQPRDVAPEPAVGRSPVGGYPAGQAEHWLRQLGEAEGAEARREVVRHVQGALASGDPFLQRAALLAYWRIDEPISGAAADRERILGLLPGLEPSYEEVALRALGRTGPRPEDVQVLLAYLAEHPSLPRLQGVRLILDFMRRDVHGPAAEALIRLLATDDARDREMLLGQLSSLRLSGVLEAYLLDLAKTADADLLYLLMRYPLGRAQPMSVPVAEAVLAATHHENDRVRTAAIYGLMKGEAPASMHARIADRMLEVFEETTALDDRHYAVRALAVYGSAAHLEPLVEAAAGDDLSPGLEKQLLDAIEAIRRR